MEPQKEKSILSTTGFSASVNNFSSTNMELPQFENASEKLCGIELIKNQYFIVTEGLDTVEDSEQVSSFSPTYLIENKRQ